MAGIFNLTNCERRSRRHVDLRRTAGRNPNDIRIHVAQPLNILRARYVKIGAQLIFWTARVAPPARIFVLEVTRLRAS
jgi:hypothetical protein